MGERMLDSTRETGGRKDKESKGRKMNKMEIEVDQGMTDTMQMVQQTLMEIDNQEEELSAKEKFMKLLLQEWRHLGKIIWERFIPRELKQLYKNTFEQYKDR